MPISVLSEFDERKIFSCLDNRGLKTLSCLSRELDVNYQTLLKLNAFRYDRRTSSGSDGDERKERRSSFSEDETFEIRRAVHKIGSSSLSFPAFGFGTPRLQRTPPGSFGNAKDYSSKPVDVLDSDRPFTPSQGITFMRNPQIARTSSLSREFSQVRRQISVSSDIAQIGVTCEKPEEAVETNGISDKETEVAVRSLMNGSFYNTNHAFGNGKGAAVDCCVEGNIEVIDVTSSQSITPEGDCDTVYDFNEAMEVEDALLVACAEAYEAHYQTFGDQDRETLGVPSHDQGQMETFDSHIGEEAITYFRSDDDTPEVISVSSNAPACDKCLCDNCQVDNNPTAACYDATDNVETRVYTTPSSDTAVFVFSESYDHSESSYPWILQVNSTDPCDCHGQDFGESVNIEFTNNEIPQSILYCDNPLYPGVIYIDNYEMTNFEDACINNAKILNKNDIKNLEIKTECIEKNTSNPPRNPIDMDFNNAQKIAEIFSKNLVNLDTRNQKEGKVMAPEEHRNTADTHILMPFEQHLTESVLDRHH